MEAFIKLCETIEEKLEFSGAYAAQAQRIELVPQDGRLRMQVRYKGGFPTPDTPAQPDPEPFPATFYSPERFIVTESLEKGTRAEFLLDGRGRIEWLRTGGRIHRKIN
jgi:hypothetical protein